MGKTIERYRKDITHFYKLAWWLHLKYVVKSIRPMDEALVVAPSLGEKKKKDAFF